MAKGMPNKHYTGGFKGKARRFEVGYEENCYDNAVMENSLTILTTNNTRRIKVR